MVFKLVRTDTEEPCKIQLPPGTHMIGRGKLLECDDKRVSRNHGELQVTDDTITIKALHQNPCFYVKKGTDETQILKRNSTADLSNGDKFGLLPASYWYEVLHCTSLDIPRQAEVTDSEETVAQEPTLISGNTTQDALDDQAEDRRIYEERPESPSLVQRSNSTSLVQGSDAPSLIQQNESPSVIQRTESPSAIQRAESPFVIQRAESPSVIQRAESPSVIQRAESPSFTPRDSPVDPPVQDQSPTQEYQNNEPLDERKSPNKRPHSPQNTDDVKRVKTEPVEVKQEPADQPGPSNDQAGSSSADKDKDGQAAAPSAKPALGRERCMYGANCYRKNPQHKAQFSHPTDSDWGTGPQGVCPWGAGCARRDARHWRDHDHPPGVERRPSPRPGMQVVERNGNIFYINAHLVNFYDDHFQVEDSDGDSVDYDYEF